MTGQLKIRLGNVVSLIAEDFSSRNLRRAQLAFFAQWTGEWAATITYGVIAYRAGGAGAVAVIIVMRAIPAAVLVPLIGSVINRYPRERIMTLSSVASGVLTAVVAALVTAGVSIWPIYVVVMLASLFGPLFRSGHSALIPLLCNTPTELSGIQTMRAVAMALSRLIGTGLAAVVIAEADAEVVLFCVAASFIVAGISVVGLKYERPPVRPEHDTGKRLGKSHFSLIADGFRAARHNRDLDSLLAIALSQQITRGAMLVFYTVMAAKMLHIGEANVGTLSACAAAGAVIGAFGAVILRTHRRLGVVVALGPVLMGISLALVGVTATELGAYLLLPVLGFGSILIEAGFYALVARVTEQSQQAPVFALSESASSLIIGVSAALAPVLISWLGIRDALIAVGAVLPIIGLLSLLRLSRLDRRLFVLTVQIRLLSQVPFLQQLPSPALETLARALQRTTVPTGEAVFSEGDYGDRFYLIADGAGAVLRTGVEVARLRRGDSFGEVALLQDVPRTATVVALSDLTLYSVDRETFVSIVNGYPSSAREAQFTIQSYFQPVRHQHIAL